MIRKFFITLLVALSGIVVTLNVGAYIEARVKSVQDGELQENIDRWFRMMRVTGVDELSPYDLEQSLKAIFDTNTLQITLAKGLGDNRKIVAETSPTEGNLIVVDSVQDSSDSLVATGGDHWEMTIIPTDAYYSAKYQQAKFVVVVLGCVVTLLLTFIVFLYQWRTAVIKALVNRRTDELSRANHELDRLSRIDFLTDVANRRYFEESLEREWSRASRGKHPVSLLMIDVDFFKKYNDQYGHIDGDSCLQQVANALLNSGKRPADLVARFGGEEFVMLLPETDEGAELLAERCRQRVEELRLLHEQSEVGPYVTVSIGGATMVPNDGKSSRALLKAADDALYQAKSDGRNRVKFV
ncbi:MAG: diguanylate cyclase [Spongiibacteraceae bacterium]